MAERIALGSIREAPGIWAEGGSGGKKITGSQRMRVTAHLAGKQVTKGVEAVAEGRKKWH